MTTTVKTTAADTILAIDLGKYKSIACLYRAADDQRFTTFPTSRAELTRLIDQHQPAVVLIHPALLVHVPGAAQLRQQVHQPGAADSRGRSPSDDLCDDTAVAVDADALDGALQRGHPARDAASFKRGTCRARGGNQAMPVAQEHLGVGADVHQRADLVAFGDAGRQQAGGCIGAYVASHQRHPVQKLERNEERQCHEHHRLHGRPHLLSHAPGSDHPAANGEPPQELS